MFFYLINLNIMAKYKGIVKLQGKIGDLVFKQVNGKGQVGMASEISKERIAKDPAFARTRENNQEFGGMAKGGKAFRNALIKVYKDFSDKKANGRLAKLIRRILNNGAGSRGERTVDFVADSAMLLGFELNEDDRFATKVNVPTVVSMNTDRNEITVTLPDFHTKDDIMGPSFATHLRLVLAVGSISNYSYDATDKKYLPVNELQDGMNAFARTVEIPISAMVGGVTTLTVQLAGAPVLDPDVVLVGALGIEFLELVNGSFYVFATDNSMQVVSVG
jgi:hypothetical protein